MGHLVAQPHKRALLEIQVLEGQTFKIGQISNPNFRGATFATGLLDLFRAYSKFGIMLGLLPCDVGGENGGGGDNNGGNNGGNGEDVTGGTGVLPGGDENSPVDFDDPSFNGTLPDDNDDGAGDVDTIPDANDKQFLCPVQIGTPSQTLNLNFDTGSSVLCVFSTETPASQVTGQTLYDPSLSSTSQELEGEAWKIRRNQRRPGSFQPTQQSTFWQNALQTLAMPLFSANLKAQAAGNYNFGFIDPTEFTGEISFVPVNTTQGFWEFGSPGFGVGGSDVVSSSHQTIADTGTTLLLLPGDIVAEYYGQVPGAVDNTKTIGGWTIPCGADLPDMFGGIQASAGLPSVCNRDQGDTRKDHLRTDDFAVDVMTSGKSTLLGSRSQNMYELLPICLALCQWKDAGACGKASSE
ncbi:uncharacterized protein MKZ38_006284 [Zalerion maritima]|uniref:Peptidase A1 domain-containing protein n=1 Tax=Zalerion maritima TaxID=339359 RepID=A0AAD5RJN7_9PEZI|nr:uncharacterized protein MKZ38_006284 [Zalerion maritima]